MLNSIIKRTIVPAMGLLLCLANPVPASDDISYAPADLQVPDGHIIIEGDIVIPIEAAYDGTYDAAYWPHGIVQYNFMDNVTDSNRQLVVDAMAEWAAVANLTFVEVPVTPLGGMIIFNNHSSLNNSLIGYQGVPQTINIHNWDLLIVAHEIGHALGFWHEQSRTDRDQYITIISDRVQDGFIHNFYTRSSSSAYGPYDFDSVMHYSQCAFSFCNEDGGIGCRGNEADCRTISVNAPYTAEWQSAIGQRTHLSYLDGASMSMIYPWDNWDFVNGQSVYTWPSQPFGTYWLPWPTFAQGVNNVPVGGTLIVQPDTYNEGETVISKNMLIRAPIGGVVIR